MIVSKIKSKSEVKTCVDMYLKLNDESFLPSDSAFSYRTLDQLVRLNKFVRVLKKEDEIIGWIFGDPCTNYHSPTIMFRQSYFCTNQTGAAAARVIRLLHDELELEAREQSIPIVISQGSHLDETNVFTRILERHGWERRGHTALKHLI